VVQHFDSKFDLIFSKLAQLNEQIQAFEVLNKTVWSQVTLSVKLLNMAHFLCDHYIFKALQLYVYIIINI